MSTMVVPGSALRNDRLANVWAVLEARNVFPVVVVVTSATAADDTHGLARGLANVAQATGRRTGLLALVPSPRSVSDAASYAHLSVAGRPATREAFNDVFVGWQAAHEVIIVDAGVLGSEAFGFCVVPKATSVVIAVCDQRRVASADHELVALLAGLQASVFGVVMTAPIPKLLRNSDTRDLICFAAPARV